MSNATESRSFAVAPHQKFAAATEDDRTPVHGEEENGIVFGNLTASALCIKNLHLLAFYK
jgi:hypothetical protein